MTPERWQQVERLYQSAVGMDAPAQNAFLSEACGADADLRREVTSLLARASSAAAFLEPQDSLRAGDRFGSYEVEALIGSGGMGDVNA